MLPKNLHQALTGLPALCQGRADHLRDWLENPTGARLAACAVAIGLGGAAYGFTLGLWRAPLMGGYVAFKLPLLIALTLLTNGLINGMLAQVLGSGLSFRQTLMALLMSYLLGLSKAQTLVLLAFSALPTAPTAYVLAARMGYDGPLVAGLVTVSTLLGLLSLPFAISLIGLLP